MRRTLGLPFLLVGILGALTIGAVVLGLVQAPDWTVLSVQNAAGETAAASGFSATYRGHESSAERGLPRVRLGITGSLSFTAPDSATVSRRLIGLGTVPPSVAHVTGASAQAALQPLRTAQQISNYRQQGSVFVGSRRLVGEQGRAVETIVVTVRVANGYAVVLRQLVHLSTPAGSTLTDVTFRFHEIGGSQVQFG